MKNIVKLDIIVIIQGTGRFRGAAHSICDPKFSVPKNIPIAIHKGSNYGYILS